MSRRPYFEVVRRDDGWLARFRGGNGRKVLTSELYTRRTAAELAVTLMAETFGGWYIDGAVWTTVDDRGAIGERRVFRAKVREVDERSAS